MRATLFSAMKNEGPYILEWAAYHRLIGFHDLVVFSNDCTDGSTELLDALSDLGWLQHFDNTSADGSSPQRRAAAAAFEMPLLRNTDWLMWLDSDEFLNVHAGAGKLTDLTDAIGPASGLCVNWRIFGSNGAQSMPDGLLLANCTRASRRGYNLNRQMKTIFRPGPEIAGLYIHKPVVTPAFVSSGKYLVNAANQRIPDEFLFATRNHGDPMHELPADLVSHKIAQVNHYAVRNFDSYVLKRHRGNGWKSARELRREGRSRYRLAFWNRHDRNDTDDLSITRHSIALAAMLREALEHPSVRLAQQRCLDFHAAEVARLAPEITELKSLLNAGSEDA